MEVHYAGDWAALYVDGELDENTVGDSEIAEAAALKRAGVKQVWDDAWMRGGNGREGVARTLGEIAEYARAREERQAKAAELRDEAKRLLAEAEALDTA